MGNAEKRVKSVSINAFHSEYIFIFHSMVPIRNSYGACIGKTQTVRSLVFSPGQKDIKKMKGPL